MDNIDEVAAYKNENGSFDVIMYLTQDGKPAEAIFKNKHISLEMKYDDGSVKLVFE